MDLWHRQRPTIVITNTWVEILCKSFLGIHECGFRSRDTEKCKAKTARGNTRKKEREGSCGFSFLPSCLVSRLISDIRVSFKKLSASWFANNRTSREVQGKEVFDEKPVPAERIVAQQPAVARWLCTLPVPAFQGEFQAPLVPRNSDQNSSVFCNRIYVSTYHFLSPQNHGRNYDARPKITTFNRGDSTTI